MLVWAMPWPSGSCCFAIATMVVSEILVTPSWLRCSTSMSTARFTISKVRCRFGSYTAASSQVGAWRGGVLRVDLKIHLRFTLLIFAAYLHHIHFFELSIALFELLLMLHHLQGQPLFLRSVNLDQRDLPDFLDFSTLSRIGDLRRASNAGKQDGAFTRKHTAASTGTSERTMRLLCFFEQFSQFFWFRMAATISTGTLATLSAQVANPCRSKWGRIVTRRPSWVSKTSPCMRNRIHARRSFSSNLL